MEPVVFDDVDAAQPAQRDGSRVDLRVATIGNVDSGKSTLVGVLTRGQLDDGNGLARKCVFTHAHEIASGRSSTVSTELMGFLSDKPYHVDVRATRQKRWQEIRAHSERSVTFVDLCGHERYLKTTIYGMTALLPDYAMVLVGANMGVARQTREHIGIAAALSLPIIVVLTKLDIAPPDVAKTTMEQVTKVLKQARRMPFVVRSAANVLTASKSILSDRITPVFTISAVTGEGLDLLKFLLATLPPRVSVLVAKGQAFTAQGSVGGGLMQKATPPGGEVGPDSVGVSSEAGAQQSGVRADSPQLGGATGGGAEVEGSGPAGSSPSRPDVQGGSKEGEAPEDGGAGLRVGVAAGGGQPAPPSSTTGETCIDSVFNVPGVGVVVAGTVLKGCIHTGATMLLGPDRSGEWQPVTVRSIHVQYTPTDIATPGLSAAFAIRPKGKLKAGADKRKAWVRKGMTLVAPEAAPCSYREFTAEVLVLHHQTTMLSGYCPIVHTGVVAQGARITDIKGLESGEVIPALRTGDRALVTFRWLFKPEYVKPGDVLLFREGRAKGVGKIRSVQDPHNSASALLGE